MLGEPLERDFSNPLNNFPILLEICHNSFTKIVRTTGCQFLKLVG